MGSSGGGTGVTSYPDYQKQIHHNWLTGDTYGGAVSDPISTHLVEVMDVMLAASGDPYWDTVAGDTVEPYDPDTDLSNILTEAASLKTEVQGMDEKVDWDDFAKQALSTVDSAANPMFPHSGSFIDSIEAAMNKAVSAATSVLASTAITNEVSAFEARVNSKLATRKSQFSAGMADINAVHSSAFAMGEALLEMYAAQEVDDYEAKLKLELYRSIIDGSARAQLEIILNKEKARDTFLINGSNEMDKIYLARIGFYQAVYEAYQKYYGSKIVAKKEETREQLEIDVNHATWDIKTFQAGANVLSSIAGGTTALSPEMSPVQSALGGMLAGASAGAILGVPGAIVGGAVGLISGLLS